MPQLLNQYSFVVLALFGWLAFVGFSRAWQRPALLVAGSAVALGVGLLLWGLLRPGASQATSLDELETVLGQGQPVLIELYSNY